MFGSQGTNTAAVAAADPHRHRCLGCLNVKPATETASKSFDSCLIHVCFFHLQGSYAQKEAARTPEV